MSRAVLSIGSNVGDRLAHLRSVADALGERVLARSPVYVTKPWGVTDQADFYNAVIIAEDEGWDPWAWLDFAQRCERDADRVRERQWGPRTLDVDIVDCSVARQPVTSAHERLVIPHRHAHERAFVLIPWLDADPGATLAGVPLGEHIAALPRAEREGVVRLSDQPGWEV